MAARDRVPRAPSSSLTPLGLLDAEERDRPLGVDTEAQGLPKSFGEVRLCLGIDALTRRLAVTSPETQPKHLRAGHHVHAADRLRPLIVAFEQFSA